MATDIWGGRVRSAGRGRDGTSRLALTAETDGGSGMGHGSVVPMGPGRQALRSVSQRPIPRPSQLGRGASGEVDGRSASLVSGGLPRWRRDRRAQGDLLRGADSARVVKLGGWGSMRANMFMPDPGGPAKTIERLVCTVAARRRGPEHVALHQLTELT